MDYMRLIILLIIDLEVGSEVAGVRFNEIAGEDITYFQSQPEFEIRLSGVADVTGVRINPETLVLDEGETSQLSASVQPVNAGNKQVSWSSSNSAVAIVDNQGNVTAVSAGNATITVTTDQGGFSDTSEITVNAIINTTASITSSDTDASEDGDTAGFTINASLITTEITVNYTISGSASVNDYIASPRLSGSVTLSPGDNSQEITISAIDDVELERSETLVLTLQPGNGYNLGTNISATITLIDNEVPECTAPAIGFTTTPPTIGGGIDSAWSTGPLQSIENTTIGSTNDFSGNWRALYDANNLYVLVNVADVTLTNDSGGEWWNDDTVEIFIDGDNSKNSAYDGINDVQLGFRWNDPIVHFGGNSIQNITGIEYSMTATGNGYLLEVSIPWSGFGVTPRVGDQLGFDVAVDDDDNGGGRDAQVASLATTDAGWTNPSVFGSVFLTTCSTDGGGGNNTPIANAGNDQSLANTISSTTLQGSGSDPDADALAYLWSQNSGPNAEILSPSSATTTINGLVPGASYTFLLSVSDGELTANDTVSIQVANSDGGSGNGEGFTIQNVWSKEYLKDDGETVGYGTAPSGDEYRWTMEDAGNGMELKNVNTGEYMHVEDLTGSIQCTNRTFGWWSSRWIISETGEGSVRIENLWQNNQFIHVENLTGSAQLGTIFPAWASAKWIISDSENLNKEASTTGLDNLISLYPNPANGSFNLQVGETITNSAYYAIYNISGKLVSTAPITATRTLVSVEGLASGVYIVKVQSNTISQNMQLLIK